MKPSQAISLAAFSAIALTSFARMLPPPLPPPPTVAVADLRADEKPIDVAFTNETVECNAFFRRVRTSFVFTNPNARTMAGEFEFPIPDGASVCGYSLEIGGEMVPGVVCEREKARVAFENEVRKGVDPGLVEQVMGNVWKTRIFPLSPKTPRKAEVEYVAPADGAKAGETVCERDGEWLFTAERRTAKRTGVADEIKSFASGTILWDASLSRLAKTDGDRARLAENLPECGQWRFVAFSDTCETPKVCKTRGEVLAAVDAVVYDGGTDIAAALGSLAAGERRALVFTDEIDTLSLKAVDLDEAGCIIASRPDAPGYDIAIERRKAGEKELEGVRESKLLATVWAARRMNELASQAESRSQEFLALGRRYGVAGPGLSLIVLENLQQWLEHKIEPPATLACHGEWVRRRAAEDDQIAAKRERAEFDRELLRYWEERVNWWKDPKPRRETPKSGLFGQRERGAAAAENETDAVEMSANAAPMSDDAAPAPRMMMGVSRSARNAAAGAKPRAATMAADFDGEPCAPTTMAGVIAPGRRKAGEAGSGASPTVTLKPWNPETPYLKALDGAAKGAAYAAYLKARGEYQSSPAFYLDCAGWFFKAGEERLARRIASNLAEFKLENAALWRSMGWRLRESSQYDDAVRAFRKALALRGEEGQSYRDLALVLAERGKREKSVGDLEEAMKLFAEAAFGVRSRRSGRRGNDMQVSVVALEELNGLIAWCKAQGGEIAKAKVPDFDAAYRRDLPMKLRIVMSWDADETDIDIHVLEPDGEEAFYRHRRTSSGGFVSEDVTTGYGPEEYLKKDLESGVYRVLSNYYASHQTSLTGATTVSVSVYTDWGTAEEKMQILTLRLDKPRNKCAIGEIKL